MRESTNGMPNPLFRRMAAGVALLAAIGLLTWNVGAAAGPLADTPWPTYGQNALRSGRSPFTGPQQMPHLKWSFTRTNDHWGTDYRGTDIGQNNTIYLAAGMAGVYSVDSRTGAKKWLFSPENTGHETWVEFPPTVFSDGTLYMTSENDYLYALNPSNGSVLWSFRSNHLHTPVSISPDGSTINFTSENGYTYALDRKTGTQKWTFQLGPYASYGTGRRIPVVYDDQGNLYFAWQSTVWSLTPGGTQRWSRANVGVGGYLVGPAVSNGTLYFISTDTLSAVAMADGALKWQYHLGGSAFDRTPTVGSDGTVYIGGDDGYLYALAPNGSLKWKRQYVSSSYNRWAGGIKSNVLLDGAGTLFFLGRDGKVYAVSSQTQNVLWSYYTGHSDASYPGLQLSLDSDGTLYCPVDEGAAIALAAPAGSNATSTPAPPPADQPVSTPTATPTATSTPVSTPTPTPTPTPLPGGNQLRDGSLEDDVNQDGIPDYWQVSNSYGALVTRSSNQHYDGAYSMLASGRNGQKLIVYQDVPVNPGESYSFSGQMKATNGSGWFQAGAQLLVLNQYGGLITTVNAGAVTSNTGGWVPAAARLTVPNSGATVRVQLRLDYLRADVYADAFSLVRTK